MPHITFPDPEHPDLPAYLIETRGSDSLPQRLREHASIIREACGASALTRDLDEAATEIEWNR